MTVTLFACVSNTDNTYSHERIYSACVHHAQLVFAGPEFIELDGDSLEIEDVIKISKGECDVKV